MHRLSVTMPSGLLTLNTKSMMKCFFCLFACFPPKKLSVALFITASRGQCENTEATDKQVGGWASPSPTTEKKKSNRCQRSHGMLEQEGPLETVPSRLYFIHTGKKGGRENGKDLFRSRS